MNLSSRVRSLEVQAKPMAEKYAREQRRDRRQEQTGRFGMIQMMCFGLTATEAREGIADTYGGKGNGPREDILNSPHFDLSKADERFQSFVDSDQEAARILERLKAYRSEGRGWREVINMSLPETESLAAGICLRAHAYCRKAYGGEFEEYESYSKEAVGFLRQLNEYQIKSDET